MALVHSWNTFNTHLVKHIKEAPKKNFKKHIFNPKYALSVSIETLVFEN